MQLFQRLNIKAPIFYLALLYSCTYRMFAQHNQKLIKEDDVAVGLIILGNFPLL